MITLEVNVLNINRLTYWLVTLSEPMMASQGEMILKLEVRRSVGRIGILNCRIICSGIAAGC